MSLSYKKEWNTDTPYIYIYILQNISQVIFLSLFCLLNQRQLWLCIASWTHFYNSDQILFSYKTFLLHSDVSYTFITFSLFWASNDCQPLNLQAVAILIFTASPQLQLIISNVSDSMCWDLKVFLRIFHVVGIYIGIWGSYGFSPKHFPLTTTA